MKFTLGLALCLLFTTGVFAQNITNSFSYGGFTREYVVHLPTGYVPGTPVPLVMMLHGLGDEMNNFMLGTGFNAQSDANTFIAVYPNAVDEFGFGRAWNNTTIPLATVDDVAFFGALLDTLEATYSVDPDRIYTAGFSMGGIMSHYLMCEWSSRIAAMASVGGPIPSTVASSCAATRPIPVLHIHGTADATVAYTGGLPGLTTVEASLEHWTQHNSCPQFPVLTNIADSRPDGITVEEYRWGLCNDSSEVLHFKLIGGDHIWPNSANDIRANVEIWEFFDRHHLNAGPTSVEPISLAPTHLYPNPSNGDFHLEFGSDVPEQIRVIDMLGNELFYKTITSPTDDIEIPASAWRMGVYLLEFRAGDRVGYQRLVRN